LNWLKAVLDLVYPPRCFLCRGLTKGGKTVCFSCQEKLDLSSGGCSFCSYSDHTWGSCSWCTDKDLYVSGIYALGPYRGNLKKLIKMYKYEGKKEVADFFIPYLAEEIGLQIKTKNWLSPEGIVPIPLHSRRLKERRFNQARILADKLAIHLDVPVLDVLKRVRDTQTQTRLSRTERWENVQGAFKLAEREKMANCLLVVDDICTSGATINEAARVLKEGGTQTLYAAVIGR